jgi:hypothetical protein
MMDQTENGEATLNEMITNYIALRDKKEAIQKQQKAVVKQYDDALEMIENYLMGHLRGQKLTSTSCDAGVAFIKHKRSATIGDAQVFREFVISNQNFDLADFRAKPEAVEDYAKEHEGQTPPGVNYRSYDAVQVNRK